MRWLWDDAELPPDGHDAASLGRRLRALAVNLLCAYGWFALLAWWQTRTCGVSYGWHTAAALSVGFTLAHLGVGIHLVIVSRGSDSVRF